MTVSLPRIFVQIASYRDPECQHTLVDMYRQAAHPERIFTGICWQFDPEEDKHCFELPYPCPEQIRERTWHWRESKGAGWARSIADGLRAGEEYTLQIDSHMRFVQDWDNMLLAMLAACPTQKALLTTMLPGYLPPESLQDCGGKIPHTYARAFAKLGIPHVHAGGYLRPAPEKPFPTPMLICNFIFGPSHAFEVAPVDPWIYFKGEELDISARLFTHGYDFYQPNALVLYHQWKGRQTAKGQPYKKSVNVQDANAFARVNHLLGLVASSSEEAIRYLDRYGLGTQRSLDDYWHYSGIDPIARTLTNTALSGKWLASPPIPPDLTSTPATLPEMSRHPNAVLPRIFVQIASYRDPECQHTIKDMFEKAAHPERIFAGVCWQFVPEVDDHCFLVPSPRPEQTRIKKIHASESRGVCWARSLTQQLWAGEEYTLQIDSHMRFVEGWDDLLLSMHAQCPSAKAVLTTYPPGYSPPDNLAQPRNFRLAAKQFDQHGILRIKSRVVKPSEMLVRPEPGAFVSCCYLFAPSQIIAEIPYDPHLYFFGEEITLAVRLWTHGWDIFHPHRVCLYHCWNRSYRPTHFGDHKDWQKSNKLSVARIRLLLGITPSNGSKQHSGLQPYQLGNTRKLQEYEAWAGIDFKTRKISASASHGVFTNTEKSLP